MSSVKFFSPLMICLQYQQYLVDAEGYNGKKIKFRFCDTMGLEDDRGLRSGDFGQIFDGKVMNNTEVSSRD